MSIIADRISRPFAGGGGIKDISFEVRKGSITGLVGPNGAGKTTTLRVLLGLTAGSGVALFDGLPLADLVPAKRRLGVVLGTQKVVSSRTLKQHVNLALAAAGLPRSAVATTLDEYGLANLASRKVNSLSLGESQRLAVAVALVGNPRIVILDEPLNGLDPHSSQWFRHLIMTLRDNGAAVLLSSHLLSEIENVADRLVVLSSGRVIADSTVADFVSSSKLGHVVVRTTEPSRLRDSLVHKNAIVTHDYDRLWVHNVSQREIADIAWENQIFCSSYIRIFPQLRTPT